MIAAFAFTLDTTGTTSPTSLASATCTFAGVPMQRLDLFGAGFAQTTPCLLVFKLEGESAIPASGPLVLSITSASGDSWEAVICAGCFAVADYAVDVVTLLESTSAAAATSIAQAFTQPDDSLILGWTASARTDDAITGDGDYTQHVNITADDGVAARSLAMLMESREVVSGAADTRTTTSIDSVIHRAISLAVVQQIDAEPEPFIPSSKASLALWMDAAADPTTFTDAGAGAISAWLDKSLDANNPVQGTGANRPLISTLNGNISALFDGTNDLLRDSSVVIGLDPISFGVVFTPTTIVGNDNNLFRLRVGAAVAVSFRRNADDMIAFYDASSGTDLNLQVSNELVANQTAFAIVRFRAAGAGNSDMLTNLGGVAIGAGPVVPQVSASDLNIGANADGTLLWTGHIHEIVVFEEFLTDADQLGLAAYFAERWTVGAP
jgi:hypothetical protein